jgi:hypothetical protein
LLADKKLPPNEPAIPDGSRTAVSTTAAPIITAKFIKKNVLTGPESFAFLPVFATLNA